MKRLLSLSLYVDLTLQEAMKLVESAAERLDAISMMKIKSPKHHTVHLCRR